MNIAALQGFCGFFVLLAIAFFSSKDKKHINWKLIISAFLLQNALFLVIRYVPVVAAGVEVISHGIMKVMDYSGEGASFIFGDLVNQSKHGFIFALVVVPAIIFISSIISLLFFFGIIQWIVHALAFCLRKTVNLSGVESLIVIADIFLGQSEGPLMIGPYVMRMTKSELACALIAGFANLSGSILGVYITFLGGGDKAQELHFANLLLTATFMNAASAIVFAKMIFPETQPELVSDDIKIAKSEMSSTIIDALMHGAFIGVKVGVAVCTALLAIIPLVHAMDGFLLWVGNIININTMIASSTNNVFDGLSLEYIFGQVFRLFAFFMGIAWSETLQVGSLLGQKVVINEFIAYMGLTKMKVAHSLSDNSIFISTFALASFSNFSSIGISLGAFSVLAPGRQKELSAIAMKCLFAAILAGFMTATVAGFWHNLLG